LERDPEGIGNWKFAGDGLGGGFAIVPKDRTEFPTLIDSMLTNSLITYRTSSGRILRLTLDRAIASTTGEGSPLTLQVDLAYNNVVVKLDATFESTIALRDASRPVRAKFTITGKDAIAAFDGTMVEPMDFEGVRGSMELKARTLSDLLKLLDTNNATKNPFSFAGDLTSEGEDWSLSKASGQLAKTTSPEP
jgi:hypothetical protein